MNKENSVENLNKATKVLLFALLIYMCLVVVLISIEVDKLIITVMFVLVILCFEIVVLISNYVVTLYKKIIEIILNEERK